MTEPYYDPNDRPDECTREEFEEAMKLPTDMLNEARRALADVLEEIGSVAMHLREAMDFAENTGPLAAVSSVDDGIECIDNAVRELMQVRDKAGRWSAWAEDQVKGETP